MPGIVPREIWYSGVDWFGCDHEFREITINDYLHDFDDEVQDINFDMQCGLLSNTHVHGLFRTREPVGFQDDGNMGLTLDGLPIGSMEVYYSNTFAYEPGATSKELILYGPCSKIPLIYCRNDVPPITNSLSGDTDGYWEKITGTVKGGDGTSCYYVHGSTTLFEEEFVVGSYIYFATTGIIRKIKTINSNTSMELVDYIADVNQDIYQEAYRYICNTYELGKEYPGWGVAEQGYPNKVHTSPGVPWPHPNNPVYASYVAGWQPGDPIPFETLSIGDVVKFEASNSNRTITSITLGPPEDPDASTMDVAPLILAKRQMLLKYYPIYYYETTQEWYLYKAGGSYYLTIACTCDSNGEIKSTPVSLVCDGTMTWTVSGGELSNIGNRIPVDSYPVWYHSLRGEKWTKYTGKLLSGFSQTSSSYPPSGDNPDNWPYTSATSNGYKYEGPKMLMPFGNYRPKDLKHLRWLIRGADGFNRICRGAPIPANFVGLGRVSYSREAANNGQYCYFFNTSRGSNSEDFSDGIIRVEVTDWKYLTLWLKNIELPFTSTKLDVGCQNTYGARYENLLVTDDGILYFAYADDENHKIGVLGIDCHRGTVYYHYQEDSTQYPLESKIYLYGAYIAFNRGPITPIEDQDWILIK